MAFGKIGQTLSALEIFDLVRSDLEKVEREIGLESVASVEAINYINQYLQAGGGKRLRPILVLLSGRMLGDVNPMLIRMAAVVEMIHTATLVHDDVIDLAKTRRGRPSINVVWGNHTSVLSGDWLYMQAFQVALRERNFHMLDLLISLTQRMVEGELLQLQHLGQIDINHRAEPRAGPHWFFFADSAAHLIQTGLQELLCVKRCATRQQFVEQDSQRVDVAARVNVQLA